MEYKPLEELRSVADVVGAETRSLSRRERLERWADLLDQEPTRRLKTLEELELVPRSERAELRSDNSPLTVAFSDPLLRADGLKSDKLGDAISYFELTQGQAHRLLCSCMNGWSMEAGSTARKIRRIANPDSRLRRAGYAVAGAMVAAPALLWILG